LLLFYFLSFYRAERTERAEPSNKKAFFEPTEVNSNTVYVAGLDWEVDETALSKHFQKFGHIVKATVLRKPRGGKIISSGCGLVEYASSSEAAEAIAQMNGTEFAGRTISCREDRVLKANGGSPRVMSATKVFVSNVPMDTLSESIHDYFATCGDVKKIEKLGGKSKKKGFWIVEFEDADSVRPAIDRLNQTHFEGQEIAVREYSEEN
jgi:RNA recognition motif-containing protein